MALNATARHGASQMLSSWCMGLCGPLPCTQSEMNRKRLRQLYSAAQLEMKRQATRAKLEEVDRDIAKWLQVLQVSTAAVLYSNLLSPIRLLCCHGDCRMLSSVVVTSASVTGRVLGRQWRGGGNLWQKWRPTPSQIDPVECTCMLFIL